MDRREPDISKKKIGSRIFKIILAIITATIILPLGILFAANLLGNSSLARKTVPSPKVDPFTDRYNKAGGPSGGLNGKLELQLSSTGFIAANKDITALNNCEFEVGGQDTYFTSPSNLAQGSQLVIPFTAFLSSNTGKTYTIDEQPTSAMIWVKEVCNIAGKDKPGDSVFSRKSGDMRPWSQVVDQGTN
jgi:hypothetical protein